MSSVRIHPPPIANAKRQRREPSIPAMSNIHGFDFLRSEHTLPSDATAFDGPAAASGSGSSTIPSSATKYSSAVASPNRPDLEKQHDVIKFLNAHRSSGCLPPHVIQTSTGVNLNPASPSYEPIVAQYLSNNRKVRIEEVPDPENPTLILPTYGYQAKFANVVDRTTLLAQINRCPSGVGVRDLVDSYDGAEADITALVAAGDVLAVANPEDKDRILFPRGEQFLVELDGVVGTGTYEQCKEDLGKAMEESNKIREQTKEAAAAAAAAADATKNDSANKAATADGANGSAEASADTAADTAAAADTTASAADTTASAADTTTSPAGATESAADTTASTAAAAASTAGATASSTTDTAQSEELRAQKLAAAISKEKEARHRLDRASHLLSTDIDPRVQIRRGEAINVGGSWFRVSSAVQDGVPLDKQPTRAQAPPSVVMMKDLSRKNDADGYVRPFGEYSSKATRGFCIPLDHPLPDEARENVRRAEAARDRLHKVAGSVKGAGGGSSRVGVTGGASSQLVSSHAVAANPDSSASAFVSSFKASVGGGGGGGGSGGLAGGRKRPGVGRTGAAGRAGAAGGIPSKTARLGDTSSTGGGDQSDPQKTLAELVQEAKEAATDPSLMYTHARRHGCTKDVREMFLATRDDVPQSEVELYNLMIHHKLIEPGEPMRRPRMKLKNPDLDNDGKPKKRRYYERKNQRMTNTHLIGTEIGAALARAAERQQQGKSVGDGGM